MPKLKNIQHELFCRAYTSRERFGNATKAYCHAYNKKPRNATELAYVTQAASRLLRQVNIYQRINELLDEEGWNDQNADKQGLFLLNQFEDLKVKLGAFKEYNALKRRVAPPVTVNINYEQFLIQVNGGSNARAHSLDKGQLSVLPGEALEDKDEGGDADSILSEQSAITV